MPTGSWDARRQLIHVRLPGNKVRTGLVGAARTDRRCARTGPATSAPPAGVEEAVGRRADGTTRPFERRVGRMAGGRGFVVTVRDPGTRQPDRELLDIAAAERRRIGQDLHDDVGPELVALGLMAATLVEDLRE